MSEKSNTQEREEHRAQINDILKQIGTYLKNHIDKVTVADFIRLLQYQRESDSTETPKEVKVTWVEQTRRSETEE